MNKSQCKWNSTLIFLFDNDFIFFSQKNKNPALSYLNVFGHLKWRPILRGRRGTISRKLVVYRHQVKKQ